MMIVDYMIIEEPSGNEVKFQKQVQQAIAEGWQPIGGISAILYKNSKGYQELLYAQAMVKYADGYGVRDDSRTLNLTLK